MQTQTHSPKSVRRHIEAPETLNISHLGLGPKTLGELFASATAPADAAEWVTAAIMSISSAQGGHGGVIDAAPRNLEVRTFLDPQEWYEFGRRVVVSDFQNQKELHENIEQILLERAEAVLDGDYVNAYSLWLAAYRMCFEDSYSGISEFAFINTAARRPGTPFKLMVFDAPWVLRNLSSEDPRLVNRIDLLNGAPSRAVLL